jgi:hypothetical protein
MPFTFFLKKIKKYLTNNQSFNFINKKIIKIHDTFSLIFVSKCRSCIKVLDRVIIHNATNGIKTI